MDVEAGEDYRARYERTLRLATALSELTPLAGAALDVPAIDAAMRTLISRAADVMEVGQCGVWRYDGVGLTCHLFYERAVRGWSSGQVVTADAAPAYLRALLAAEAVPANDARKDPRTSELTESYLVPFDIGAMLDAAMSVHGAFGGVVCFEHLSATRRWLPEEIRFAIGIAGLAGVLVERHEQASRISRADPVGLQFNELYDDVRFGVVTFALDGAIRRVNPYLLAMFGSDLAPAQHAGRPLAELLGDAMPDLVELRGRLTAGPVHVRHVGARATCDFTFTALRGATGLPTFIACIALDRTLEAGVHDTVKAIAGLPANASLVELLTSIGMLVRGDCMLIGRTDGEGSVHADPMLVDGKVVAPVTYALVGTPCENVVHSGVCTYPTGAIAKFPDDRMLLDLGFDSYAGAPLHGLHGEVVGLLAILGRKPLAPELPVEDLVGAFAKLIEVTLQRELAEREAETHKQFLRHIADNIAEVFWVVTWPERTFLYVTPSVEVVTGRSSIELMSSGRQLRDLVHPADVGELAKQVAAGKERFELEHRAIHPDGSTRQVKTHAFFIRDDAGKPVRLAGVSEDITVQRDAEAALRASEHKIAELLSRTDTEVARLQTKLGEASRLGGLLGTSSMMRDVFRRLRQAADSEVTVLITGESGTGKELAAAAIHELGARRGKPFVALNCAAIPETLLESELFGYVKGAFTGASRDKVGLLQAAHGGTLFLDEIGDMPASLQVKMLRALQQREIRRLGDEHAVAIDIRLISATHRDLRALVATGQVREDFFYRIRVFEIDMPPLRARPDDIPMLASHFATELGRLANKPHVMIAQDAMKRLVEYDWPGNVRELRNAIERAIVGVERGAVQVGDLPPEVRGETEEVAATVAPDVRGAIEEALRQSGGNRTEAARLLGISRVTLWKRMRRLGLAAAEEDE